MVGSASALTCSIRRSKCFFASFTVVAFIGIPSVHRNAWGRAITSRHVLFKVLQMLIVLSYDSQHPFTTAENWLGFCRWQRDQLRHRLLIARDNHFFTQSNLVDQFRQLRLRFLNGKDAHDFNPCWYWSAPHRFIRYIL